MGLERETDSRPRSGTAIFVAWGHVVLVLFAYPPLMRGNPVGTGDYYGLDHAGQSPVASLEGASYLYHDRRFEDVVGEPTRAALPVRCPWQWQIDCLARGYYLDDQRIQWSGVEASFGVEGIVAPVISYRWGDWETVVQGEFYLNQPLDRNVLLDTPERASYAANYDVDPFEISQLSIGFRRGDLALEIGKMVTPFGRAYFPLLTNARLDAPFIRTESILWRETGLLVRYDPGWLVADVAVTNGCEDRDTNSSKALVARLGVEGERWAVGVSVKTHDGIGSEGQKVFNDHVGMDFMVRSDRWVFSGEVIYDEYGFRKPGFDPLDITWGRSIYYRDQHYKLDVPVTGIGYYLSLGYEGARWQTWMNYGEFYPQQLGDPMHDVANRRGIIKVVCGLTSHLALYSGVIVENGGYVAQEGRTRRGLVVLAGLQWTL